MFTLDTLANDSYSFAISTEIVKHLLCNFSFKIIHTRYLRLGPFFLFPLVSLMRIPI